MKESAVIKIDAELKKETKAFAAYLGWPMKLYVELAITNALATDKKKREAASGAGGKGK
jgi:hypothetical protein